MRVLNSIGGLPPGETLNRANDRRAARWIMAARWAGAACRIAVARGVHAADRAAYTRTLLMVVVRAALVVLMVSGVIGCSRSRPTEAVVSEELGRCTECHGSGDNSAPPPDTRGQTNQQAMGVGAHAAHTDVGGLRAPIECETCHLVPRYVSEEGHIDTPLPAEVVWGELALLGGAAPVWNPIDGSCTSTYCHGEFPGGIQGNAVYWNVIDPPQAVCGSCHSIPSTTGSHPSHLMQYEFGCTVCHEGYEGDSTVAGDRHIDGSVDVLFPPRVGGTYADNSCSGTVCHGGGGSPAWGSGDTLDCTGCHGGMETSEGAPPPDLAGDVSTGARGVGAHTSHLTEGEIRVAVGCDECHTVPSGIADAGHLGAELLPAEVVWGTLAGALGADPDWEEISFTCTGVYCHGATLQGGPNREPIWTVVDGSQAACGSCHRLPPHTDFGFGCDVCHGSVVAPDTTITEAGRALHINGEVNF